MSGLERPISWPDRIACFVGPGVFGERPSLKDDGQIQRATL